MEDDVDGLQRRDDTEGSAARTAECIGCVEPLRWLLLALWVLNVLDLVLTRDALARGVAVEANKIMSFFQDAGPGIAVVFKIGVVSTGILCLWLLRRHRATLVATAPLDRLRAEPVLSGKDAAAPVWADAEFFDA